MSSLRLQSFSAPLPKDEPYVLSSDEGETITLIGSGSIMRYLATGKETEDAFAVMQTRARDDEAVPAHFHAHTHDTFLVTQGSIKLWANDQCRILYPGDFGSIPPNVVHAFQVLQPETEFIGIVAPGSWLKFFDYIGEPYVNNPTYPASDRRHFPVNLFIEGVKAGEDVKPVRDYNYPEVNGPTEPESEIPSGLEPYYLRHGMGPKYFINSQSCSPLITTAQSHEGRFALSIVSGVGPSETYPKFKAAKSAAESSPFGTSKVKLNKTHTLCRIIEGKVEFALSRGVDGQDEKDILTAGESILIPAGMPFSYEILSAFAKFYVFSGKGGGLEEVFIGAGRKAEKGEVVGDVVEDITDVEKVREALKKVTGEIV